jgi:predicted dehydrogenase/threonine dehydrogenase-like Zn-dependent dehydrogenase
MRQISQNYKTGAIKLEDLPPPNLRPGGVLVRSAFSVVSVGTEAMKVREGRMSLLAKARARPDQVKQVLASVQQQGLAATYRKVTNKLDSLTPLGYSTSGIVEAVGAEAGEFTIGQRVACAGAGYANHAELNFIPKNLAVAVPDAVSLEHAAFTTVGAIALHALRQAQPQIGETTCVIGLGLLGQILVQLLRASGVNVVGLDLSPSRCDLAMTLGAGVAGTPDDPRVKAQLMRLTHGHGADSVIIAAGGSSNAALESAIQFARDRARIVSLGKTGLDVPWKEFFERELELHFSRSYGPGRYDPSYEEKGVDYPIGYVRWTERRNMEAFLGFVADGHVRIDPIISGIHAFDEAERVYADLATNSGDVLGILFKYADAAVLPQPSAKPATIATPKPATPRKGVVRLCVIGAGNYASSMLLPHLTKRPDVRLVEVVTSTGLSATNAVRKFGFERSGTAVRSAFERGDFDAVLIATRHASHARLVSEALRTGLPVFVEKPLSIDHEGLTEVARAVAESGNDRLQVGFNRRFAPMVVSLKKHFGEGGPPLVMTYRVHAGPVDAKSWYADPAEGTRFVGEAGHFFDTMSYIASSAPVSVLARRIPPATPDDMENLTVVVTYANGSVGTLLYLTQGSVKVPKEVLEVFGGGKTAHLDNFRRLNLFAGNREKTDRSGAADKGQRSQLEAFLASVRDGRPMPISMEALVATTRTTLAAQEAAISGLPVIVAVR